jgi:hypothetical protein
MKYHLHLAAAQAEQLAAASAAAAHKHNIYNGNKMKITRKQLRNLIKEEMSRTLNESIVDTGLFDAAIKESAERLSDMFGESMMRLWDEDALMMKEQGYTDKQQWEQQVVYAQQELDTGLDHAINEKISEIESRLHDGEYYDHREEQQFQGSDADGDGRSDKVELEDIAAGLE